MIFCILSTVGRQPRSPATREQIIVFCELQAMKKTIYTFQSSFFPFCCPIEMECKPQMWPTYVILHFVVTTLKSKRKHEINFNILTHIPNILSFQHAININIIMRCWTFFLLRIWDPVWILHRPGLSIWSCCISPTLQSHRAGGAHSVHTDLDVCGLLPLHSPTFLLPGKQ